ncbi:MAG TPA: hypothetical protein VGJ04_08805 [Pirellulales bacterium]
MQTFWKDAASASKKELPEFAVERRAESLNITAHVLVAARQVCDEQRHHPAR